MFTVRPTCLTLVVLPLLCSGCVEPDSDPVDTEARCAATPVQSVAAPLGSLIDDPLSEFPSSFFDVGLYPYAPDFSTVADAARSYTPLWPLWSNGSAKRRFIRVPEGAAVDNGASWLFPAGTLLFKTFFYPDDEGCLVPLETRIIRTTSDGWDYVAYQWNEHATDATLLDMEDRVVVPLDGFEHTIPAELDCRSCHESAPATVLGFSELQLNDVGASPTQLEALRESGLLANALPDQADAIEAPADTREVLGIMEGNCTHCHNDSDGPSSSFDLRHPVALQNTIDQPTESSGSAAGIRIVPGDPAASILFSAFSGESDDPDVKPMPPIGVDVRDAEAIEVMRNWILELTP